MKKLWNKIGIVLYSAAVAVLIFELVWLFKPLKSHKWDIEFDKDMENKKKIYLDSLSDLRTINGRERPNIILIAADDLGLTDISFYANEYGKKSVNTPNIDSIGTEGTAFNQAYASAPICSPSRAGLMTGRYQNRYGFESQPMHQYLPSRFIYYVSSKLIDTEPMKFINNDSIPFESQYLLQGMPPSEILLSEALSSAGYTCSIDGKWHLGYGDLQYPTNRGFDKFYGFLEAYTYYADPERPDIESYQFDVFHEKHIWKGERNGYCAIHLNDEIIEEKTHLTDAIAREACKDIVSASKSDEPFFIYVPFNAPHTPFQALKSYTDNFSDVKDPRKRIYYALIAQLDDAVGRILDTLEETGEAENTIVIFTSDNGGNTNTGATGNDPLKGGKMSHFEGGLSVPLFIKWPRKIKPGKIINEPVTLTDIFPTVLGAAGIPLPDDRIIDGKNLLSADSESILKNRTLYWRSTYNHIVLHDGWKLLYNGKDGKTWLYNINNDRLEEHNLAEEMPDMVNKLMKIFSEWNKAMKKPSWPRVMDYYYNDDGEGYWFAI